ncbi:MAG: DNA translocase FtsK [Pirellulaceae bacterium]
MFEQRSVFRDLVALGLTALTLFLGLALVSYHPDDPVGELPQPFAAIYAPDPLVFPQATEPLNVCGGMGALAADLLVNLLGLGAYYGIVSLAILVGLLLLRKPITHPAIRLAGWLASLAGITALVTILLPEGSPGPVIGPGGRLGLVGQLVLSQYFATMGGVLVCLTMIAGGLLLCTDYELLRISFWVGGTCKKQAEKGCVVLRAKREQAKAKALAKAEAKANGAEAPRRTDVEEGIELEEIETSNGVRIKIGGRRLEPEEVESEEELEVEEIESNESEEVEEETDVAEEEFDDTDELEEEELDAEVPITRVDPPQDQPLSIKNRKSKKQSRDDDRANVMDELNKAVITDEPPRHYELPPIELLIESDDFSFDEQEKEVRRKAKILEKTFGNFGFNVKVVEIETGPVIAQYEVELEAGLRLSKITGLSDDLAIALRVPSVRIVAPIPGKNTVGIEVPNDERQMVRLREVMEESNGRAAKMKIPIFLGKDVSGNPLVVDLAAMPHLLIAGRTGTGKSVCLNALISSILMTRRPDEVRMLMIDPKMVELSCYRTLPHLMHPVVTDMKKAEAILAWAVEKMEERYQLLAKAGVRHLSVFNQLGAEEIFERLEVEDDEEARKQVPTHLPYIVIVADEIADMMMTAGKEVEQHIIRLAQKSRAVGIHLILATQKPTVDVITGLIKSNLPARLAFQVASRTDSRVVLDEMGADKLLGNGDMLFLWPGTSTLMRGQGTYLSDEEINAVVDFVSTGEQDFVKELVQLKIEDGATADPAKMKKRDDMYEQAVDVIIAEQRGSVSLLQRALGVGYGRGARLIDFMAEDGIVGPYNGSQAREVMISPEDWELMKTGEVVEASEDQPVKSKRRGNKINPHDEDSIAADEEDQEDESLEYEEEDAEDDEESDSGESEEDLFEEEDEDEEYYEESA